MRGPPLDDVDDHHPLAQWWMGLLKYWLAQNCLESCGGEHGCNTASNCIHDYLHSFLSGRVMGTATTEAKLA